jgi:hypothetical protein
MPQGFGYLHKTELAYGNGRIETTQLWPPPRLPRAITSGYLTAMQTPLFKGRNFTAEEDLPSLHAVATSTRPSLESSSLAKIPSASTFAPRLTAHGVMCSA